MTPQDLPSIYPGAIIGLLVGIALGNWKSGIVGIFGGIVGAGSALILKPWLAGIFAGSSFITLVLLSAAFALVFVKILHWIR